MNKELKIFGWFAAIFLVAYIPPLPSPKVTAAILEAFTLTRAKPKKPVIPSGRQRSR
jgi:hypothetical protein